MMTLYIIASSLLLLMVLVVRRRKLFTGVISAIKQVFLAQPDVINLRRAEAPQWKRGEAVEALTKEYLAEGFSDAGVYSIDKMPGVLLRIMTGPGQEVIAVVYDHPAIGVWTDIVSVYEDGSNVTVTTAPETGVPDPEWNKVLHLHGQPAAGLYSELLRRSRRDGLRRLQAGDVPREIEKAHYRHSAWLKQRNLSLADVERMSAKVIRESEVKAPYIIAKRAQARHDRRQWKFAAIGLIVAGIMLMPAYAILVLGWKAHSLRARGKTAVAEVTDARHRKYRERREFREVKYRFRPEGGDAVYTHKDFWGGEDAWTRLRYAAYDEAVRTRRLEIRYDPLDPWNHDTADAPGISNVTDSSWFFVLCSLPFLVVGLLALALGGCALLLALTG